MEATLPPSKPSDCPGHFYDNTKALPHSVMLFHNGDLVGKAISEFTGLDLPFKRCDFGQEPGMRMLSWTVRYFIQCIDMFTFFVLLCSQSLNFVVFSVLYNNSACLRTYTSPIHMVLSSNPRFSSARESLVCQAQLTLFNPRSSKKRRV